MIFKVDDHPNAGMDTRISLRCPAPGCRQMGTLEPIGSNDIVSSNNFLFGQRRCPNPKCRTHIFFAYSRSQGQILGSYPPERIDFDATNIPPPVTSAFEEALTCHAHRCFVAAAIMVRKTLEELCRERGAQGGNLKERIHALGTKVVLPKELLDGLDNLRLLGNDAAHVESQEFNQVGQQEVELSIDVAKEVLKAVYQYSALVDRLQALKKLTRP